MRRVLLLAIALLLAACGRSRELTGTTSGLVPEQLAWLERNIEADFAEAPLPAGARVVGGRIIARIDGEIIACRPLMLAALRGAAASGAVEVDEGGEAAWLIKGEISVQPWQEARAVKRRYTFIMQLVELASHSVVWSQHYTIANTSEQERWK